jgi:predicted double-glycine peptidase
VFVKTSFALINLILTISALIWWQLPKVRDFPESFEISGFNYLEQPDEITCGPTSALMVLERYGKHHSLDDVKIQTKTKWISYSGSDIGMTSPDYVARSLKYFDVSAHMIHGSLNDLKFYVSQSRPPVVLLRSGRKTWHYVVVIGYTKDNIILADPGRGARREVKTSTFLSSWNFTSDINGNSVVGKCVICNGIGRIGVWNLGPLNVCDACSGSGKSPDFALLAVRASEVNTRTMIVPNIPLP